MVPSSGGYTVMPQKSIDSNATDSSDWEDIFEVVLQAPAAPPITPETPNTTSSESMSDIDISNNNTEVPSRTAFLDLTADDEYQPLRISIGTTVTELINDAKKHQLFGALFKLHAVQNQLELLERFRHIPNIQNPTTRTSLAVERSMGKGPFFAKRFAVSSCLSTVFTHFCLQDLENTTHPHLF